MKWEYLVLYVYDYDEDNKKRLLNLRGQEGWRLVQVVPYPEKENAVDFYFERPILESDPKK